MAQDPWNKVHVPFPSAVSSSRVPFTDATGFLVESLLADCEKVLILLCSEVLQTEIRVMYKLLFVLNNGFRQHKPFRALKQVEQCINRLKEMKLQEALEDLKELCPSKIQRNAGIELGQCYVPSQPMLEWLCLKLLGASSLLARTMERCTQAFLYPKLTRQHLQLGEFIVLNVVMTSMLSRLWVFFRGILGALIPVYEKTIEFLQKVAQSQPMAYLTDFILPKDLKDFLLLSYPDLLIKDDTTELSLASRRKKNHRFYLLNSLFKDTDEEDKGNDKRELMPILASGHHEGSSMDLGTTVLRQQPEVSQLDMKGMLRQSYKTRKQVMSPVPQIKLDISSQAGVSQKRKFLNLLRKVSSFSNMAAQLKEVIHCCRSSKFHQERKRLAFLHLKCLRMEGLETEGIRMEKRLKLFKIKVQKALMLQKKVPQKCSSSLVSLWRTRWHRRSSIRSLMRHERTARRRSALERMCSGAVKDLFGVSLKNRKNCSPTDQSSKDTESEHNVAASHEEEKLEPQTVVQKPSNLFENDIDDIFASIGF